MKLMTFVTEVAGLRAKIVGAHGMNFEANFYGAKNLAYWVAIALMTFLGLASVVEVRKSG